MKDSHTKEKHHDHAKMDRGEHMSAEVKAPADHTNHMKASSSSQDLHASAKDHKAHGMSKEGEHAGHVDHSGHEDLFRKRFWVSLLLSIPVLLYTPMLQMWFGFTMPNFVGSQWVAPVFSIAVFLYGGVPFIQMAMPEIRNRQSGMMTLISLAILVAFVYSLAAVFLNLGEGFFWELVTLIDIMLLGHWIEMRSVRQASGALSTLAKLMPDTAEHIMPDGNTHTMPVSALKVGHLVLVRPGASIPADGVVAEGESEVNESMITGESRPVKKRPGDKVIAGTINSNSSLRVRVTAVGEQTALAGIMRLVREAQNSKSRTQILADKAAGWLFYLAIGVALLSAIFWTIAIGLNLFTLERVVTVLVIACPHALGLAVPLVVAISTTSAAQNGILVRNRFALEAAREIDVVIFDKTGTLTKGEQGVVGIKAIGDENEALALTAAVEGDSEHIIASAIRKAAQEKKLTLPIISDFEAIKGRGIRANVNGKDVWVGGPRLLEMLNVEPNQAIADFAKSSGAEGQTVIYLIQEKQVLAAFALADVIRPESYEAVKKLKEMNIQVAMLTGDSKDVAKAVANELGVNLYFAEVLPEHKDEKVVELQKQGKKVAMVGDGVNDAPALVRADVGIAIGSGTDVAIESAGIILVRSNPFDVVKIFRLSRASYRKMIENLVWASGYNVVALPLAAGVLAWAGILLSPAVGALLMSVSTVIVALNAQLLRRVEL